MAGDILTYAPSAVTLVLCGYVLTGVVNINLKWNSSPFTVKKGIRGQHTRIGSRDRQATCLIEVLQTSITNDILSSILDQDTTNYSGRLEFEVKDTSGTSHWHSTQCFLKAWPDTNFGCELETRKWEIEILSFNSIKVGGNARQGFDLFDSFSGASDYISNGVDSLADDVSNIA